MQDASRWERLPPALIATIVAAIVLALASPFFALPIAPVLVIVGVAALRRTSDPLARGLAWGAIAIGIALLAVVGLVILGLVAVGASGSVHGVFDTVASPWPVPPATP
jgi:hypothetical protein